jgi:enoyl-[acyl-carrier protein] reductase/trans-2-enoyl-CoA reductase (NAD+)
LRETAQVLDAEMQQLGGRAFVSVNKAVVTQASSALPVVPLYISILFKVMKEAGLHEDCIEQIDRLFRTRLFGGELEVDSAGRIRLDDLEMRDDIQEKVKALWPSVSTETIDSLTDFAGYQENFLRLFGFGLEGVDYDAPTDPDRAIPSLS